jgi:hypothetical protein
VTNGDFATGDTTGWTLSDPVGGLLVYDQGLAFNAQNRGVGSSISQTITVEPGLPYVLTYTAWENGSGLGDHLLMAEVLNSTGLHAIVDWRLLGNGQTENVTIPFTPMTPQVVIRFTNAWASATVATDVVIDNIVVRRP